MTRAADGRLIIVLDSSILFNFLRLGRLDLLCEHRDYRFVLTENVIAEVTDTQQAQVVSDTLAQKLMDKIQITDQAELKRVADLNAFLGIGESTAIAIAESRGFIVGLDEGGRARREIDNGPAKNRLITTPGVLLSLIRNGTITVQQADAMKQQLETLRFKMTFNSFADLI